ncbi:hypothetical protein C0J52_22070 [Blattella germanica]|nr:hypothetical protein C0J52_22070 [Blattella germanica]
MKLSVLKGDDSILQAGAPESNYREFKPFEERCQYSTMWCFWRKFHCFVFMALEEWCQYHCVCIGIYNNKVTMIYSI